MRVQWHRDTQAGLDKWTKETSQSWYKCNRGQKLKMLFVFNSRIMLVGLACVTESRETMAYVSYRLVPSADWDGD